MAFLQILSATRRQLVNGCTSRVLYSTEVCVQ